MQTIVLHGSPRKGGDSDTLADAFLKGVGEGVVNKVHHFYLNEMSIKPCQGCLRCATSMDHQCIIRDDMDMIYAAFKTAQLVIWATPMYWGYLTAQLKTALDRMESLVMGDHFNGKTFVVLITYHYHCDSAVAFFQRVCPFFHVTLHTVTCRTLDPDTGYHQAVSQYPDKLAEAWDLGKRLERCLLYENE